MWSRTGRERPRDGFTLVEALVALVVAGLLLPSLAHALASAWTATRGPMEVVSAMVVAREAVEQAQNAPSQARNRSFAIERSVTRIEVLELASQVAPAPRGTGSGDDASKGLDPQATPTAMRLIIPKDLGRPKSSAASTNLALWRVSIVVRTPSGHRVPLDSVKLDDAAR